MFEIRLYRKVWPTLLPREVLYSKKYDRAPTLVLHSTIRSPRIVRPSIQPLRLKVLNSRLKESITQNRTPTQVADKPCVFILLTSYRRQQPQLRSLAGGTSSRRESASNKTIFNYQL